MIDSYLLAGRFGAATRLSPKALRLYAEQGLLIPARVDRATGYRYYAAEQAPRARLIARLRGLGLTVARIKQLIDLSPEERMIELRTWLGAQSERLDEQTGIVEAMARQAEGGEPELARSLAIREVAAGKIIYRQGHVGIDALDDFMRGAEADIRAHLRASGLPGDGVTTVHFHEAVTRDGDGRIEVAIAYDGSVEPVGDLRIRLQPVRREVYLPVPKAYEDFPVVLRVYDTLEAWLDKQNGFNCIDSPYEIYPGTGGARFDVAYPVAVSHAHADAHRGP